MKTNITSFVGCVARTRIIKGMLTLCLFSAPIALAQQSLSYTYNNNGQILTADGSRTDVSDVVTFTYNDNGYRTSIQNPLGHTTTLNNFNGRGQAQQIIDANGTETLLTYHVRGWLLSSSIQHPSSDPTLASTTTYDYDNVGHVTRITLPNNVPLNYHYDASNRLVAVSNAAGERIDYTLDAAGNRTAQTIQDGSSTITYTMTRAYDELSRVMEIVGAEGQTTQLDYDVNNNATETINPRSNATQNTYDPLDRLTQTTDADNGTTQFGYDHQNRLTRVTDANGNSTTYEYDAFDNLVKQISPDTGTTTYTYDNANNRISMTDAKGITANYGYDALNRLTAVNYDVQGCTSVPEAGCTEETPSALEENITYTYDLEPEINASIGRLSAVVDQHGSTHYQYDHRGNIVKQVVRQTSTIDTTPYVTQYAYNVADQLTQMTYPSGLVLQYHYDNVGRVVGMTSQAPSQALKTVVENITYLPFGGINSLTYGNGITTTLKHNADYRLTELKSAGISTIVDVVYSYDPNGNIVQQDRLAQATLSQLFGYDALDRLEQADGDYGQLSYSYDPLGNRLDQLLTEGGDSVDDLYSYAPSSNQLDAVDTTATIAAATTLENRLYQKDANGNITDDGRHTYEYNLSNRLISVDGEYNYAYNALSQRIRKTVSIDYAALAAEQAGIAQQYTDNLIVLQAQADQAGTNATAYQVQVDSFLAAAQILRTKAEKRTTRMAKIEARIEVLSQRNIDKAAKIVELTAKLIADPQTDRQIRKNERLQARIGRITDKIAIIETKLIDKQARVGTLTIKQDDFIAQAETQEQNAQEQQQLADSAQQQVIDLTAQAQAEQGLADAAQQLADEYTALAQTTGGFTESTFSYNLSGQVIGEYTAEGAIKEYIYLAGIPISLTEDNHLYAIHSDHLGTPVILIDENQQKVWEARYTPFGEAEIVTEVVTNNLRFSGQYFDSESGLHYNYFRYYDPSTGRYTQSDPIGLGGGINTYAYVSNNPLIYTDPLGLVQDPVTRHMLGHAAKGNWGEVNMILREVLNVSGKELAKRARQCASKRGGDLVKQFKKDGAGTGARSGQHGTPFKKAGNELIKEANKLPKGSPLREALKKEGTLY